MLKNSLREFILTIVLCITIFISSAYGKTIAPEKPQLKFRSDGTFKIIQFTDSQDGPNIDIRTIKLMENILDFEKPDLVVLTGDNIDGRCKSSYEVRKAIDNIAQPMEKRQIPWAIVFGNHDTDHHRMSKLNMMNIYRSYANNISEAGLANLDGVGNYNLLIKGSKNSQPVFNIYMLDSLGLSSGKNTYYDYIKPSQIAWYKETSLNLKKLYNKQIPSLMFFHIPLMEFKEAYKLGKVTGSRNEEECPSEYNSGLFNALVEAKDVKGVFTGHDHSNDYVAELKGIKLGYSRSIGYGTYIKQGVSRGGRVFLLNESNPEAFKTWMRLETDFVK